MTKTTKAEYTGLVFPNSAKNSLTTYMYYNTSCVMDILSCCSMVCVCSGIEARSPTHQIVGTSAVPILHTCVAKIIVTA